MNFDKSFIKITLDLSETFCKSCDAMVKKEILVVTLHTLNGDIEKEYVVLIGENAKENSLLVKESEPEDLWFHLENVSSAHIVLQSGGEVISQRYLNEVASKLFKCKKNVPPNTNVIYTEIKNVKLTKTPGLVETRNTRVIKF